MQAHQSMKCGNAFRVCVCVCVCVCAHAQAFLPVFQEKEEEIT